MNKKNKEPVLVALALGLLLGLPARSADLEREIRSRWLGAWVVTRVDTYSDCAGVYTNNRVNKNLVKSSGARAFRAGELAKLDRIDAKRSRLDLHLSLAEPVLAPYRDGPFTLYRELECRVELQLELPRETVRGKDTRAIDRAAMLVLERHATREEARTSPRWNGRVRDPYPEDYDTTLAQHAAWKAEQANAAVQARLDQALAETSRLRDRVSEDPHYLVGLARGVAATRAAELADTCPALLAIDLAAIHRVPPSPKALSPAESAEARGVADGRLLVYGLELLRRLPGCFVPVPPVPEDSVSASR
jgi:hypothetical protein